MPILLLLSYIIESPIVSPSVHFERYPAVPLPSTPEISLKVFQSRAEPVEVRICPLVPALSLVSKIVVAFKLPLNEPVPVTASPVEEMATILVPDTYASAFHALDKPMFNTPIVAPATLRPLAITHCRAEPDEVSPK